MKASDLRVLVVENDPDAAEIIAIVVEGMGCSCEIATSMRAAQTLIAAYDPDLLILDEHLGDGSGLELARSLRRDKRGVFIISFSGSGARGDEFDAYLVKPVSVSRLRESVLSGVSALARAGATPV